MLEKLNEKHFEEFAISLGNSSRYIESIDKWYIIMAIKSAKVFKDLMCRAYDHDMYHTDPVRDPDIFNNFSYRVYPTFYNDDEYFHICIDGMEIDKEYINDERGTEETDRLLRDVIFPAFSEEFKE
jgi:hypothetical protein